jgi:hypothetical protein
MKSLVGFAILVLLISSSVGIAQTEDATPGGIPALGEVSYLYTSGGSARATAMGNAFVGLANDVSGGLYNPAGLWILEGPQMAVSFGHYAPKGEYNHSLTPASTINDATVNTVSHFSFTAPARIKGHPWVFNFNYNRNNNFYDKTSRIRDVNSGLYPEPDTYVLDYGYMRYFNFGASTRLYKQLSMGFTVNISDARRFYESTEYTRRIIVINPVYGITAEQFTTDELLDSTSSSGFNFTIGTMWKGDKYSVGGVVHTPYKMNNSSDRSRHITTTENGLVSLDYTQTVFVVDSLAQQDIPLTFALGGGFFPSDKLTLTLDMIYHNYGSTSWYYRTNMFFEANGERTDFYDEYPIQWNNTMGVGAGAEYVLQSKYGRIPLRAGFRFDQLPQSEEFTNSFDFVVYEYPGGPPIGNSEIAIVTRKATGRQTSTGFSLGTGIGWSQVTLDIAYKYTGGTQMTITNEVIYYDSSDDVDPVKSDQETHNFDRKSHDFIFTFTGYF